jgi:hypothetical protein
MPIWAKQMLQAQHTLLRNQHSIMSRIQQQEARVWNEHAARHNLQAIILSSRAPITFRPFRKVNPGLGDPLPDQMANPTLQLLRVGALVQKFPRDFDELQMWSHSQINDLAILLNETFEIQAGDGLVVRRNLVRRFIANDLKQSYQPIS